MNQQPVYQTPTVYSYAAELIDEYIANARPAQLANRPAQRALIAAIIRDADRQVTPEADDDETVSLDDAALGYPFGAAARHASDEDIFREVAGRG